MWFIPIIQRSVELKISRQEFLDLMKKNTLKGFSMTRLAEADNRYFEYETIFFKNALTLSFVFLLSIANRLLLRAIRESYWHPKLKI